MSKHQITITLEIPDETPGDEFTALEMAIQETVEASVPWAFRIDTKNADEENTRALAILKS